MTDLGRRSLGVLELTALPSIGRVRWEPWMRESGLATCCRHCPQTVWVGRSAGSVVPTLRIGGDFVAWPAAQHDRTLRFVDVAIFPHLDELPGNSLAEAQRRPAH